ncbi:MAG: FAD-dependent oxidoreductase [Eubacteriales bacterium]|nr:FAD-dependent oxidoreductase [Eubacteriales bacterium]
MERAFTYDVVVAGGGTAGVAAAAGAVKTGAKTLLIEREAYMGGEATHAGVSAFCGFYSCGKDPIRVVRGVGDLVLEELGKIGKGYDDIVSASGNRNINFQPEYLKCALDNLMEKENVDVFLHAAVTGAEVKDGRIRELYCMDDEGAFTVKASAFVDATGNAGLVRMGGAKAVWGGSVQAATLTFRMSGVDTACDMSPAAVEKAILQAKADGIPYLTKEKGFILKKEGSDIVAVLLPSVVPTGISAEEMTRMEFDTRRQVLYYVEALKKYMHGMELAELAVIGPSLGMRETYKMAGRETVLTDDVLSRRKREDGIARGGWKPEIHKDVNKMGTYIEVAERSYFDIPLGAIRSANLDNLYGAGRMISADDTAFAAVRVMGTCFATGHAAGVAAALNALAGKEDAGSVREALKKQGALV